MLVPQPRQREGAKHERQLPFPLRKENHEEVGRSFARRTEAVEPPQADAPDKPAQKRVADVVCEGVQLRLDVQ